MTEEGRLHLQLLITVSPFPNSANKSWKVVTTPHKAPYRYARKTLRQKDT